MDLNEFDIIVVNDIQNEYENKQDEYENVQDENMLKNICRFCLAENENNLCIFSIKNENEIEENLLEYKEIFEIHSGLQLIENDGLPSGICLDCLSQFDSANKLWRQCQEADKKIRTKYQNLQYFDDESLEKQENKEIIYEIMPVPEEKSSIITNNTIKETFVSDKCRITYPCKVCGKLYLTEKFLMKHEQLHKNSQTTTNNETIKEEENYSIITFDDCKYDQTIEVSEENEQEFKIQQEEEEEEDNISKEKIIEQSTEKIVKNSHRFLCHICSKSFSCSSNLIVHLRGHAGIKPYICQYCKRAFQTRAHCTQHERTHTGDKPYVCHYCGTAFAKSYSFKQHLTIHTGEANYHCKTCGKSFKRLKYLKEHGFTHTGEKPYACKLCGVAYSHTGSLFAHKKKCKLQQSSV